MNHLTRSYSHRERPPFNIRARQSFNSLLLEFKLFITSKDYDDWRITYPSQGDLRGRPNLGSILCRATNGLYCFVECHDYSLLRIHKTNFLGVIHICPPKQSFEEKKTKKSISREATLAQFRRKDLEKQLLAIKNYLD